ncbi:PDZ domain [Trinorchestia longiramus]|nr:PDZ domain [Trinorchestia longiramus]
MAVVTVGFRWLDILEKEFDKAFVDLEVLVGDVCEYEEGELVAKAQHRLQSLSSCFAQLTHKAQTIFQNNAKLEAELVHLRREVAETRGRLSALQDRQLLLEQGPQALSDHNSLTSEHTKLLNNHETELLACTSDLPSASSVGLPSSACTSDLPSLISSAEVWWCAHVWWCAQVSQLQRENRSLRRLLLRLQGELCGARLAAKYLDKELAGRIQQLQLLGRETQWHQQEDKLWRQLEAEINLHRHKTVVRACRANIPAHTGMQSECTTASEEASEASGVLDGHLHDDQPRPRPQHHERTVVIHKQLHQNLGMSVTGGREHGVPIVVSVVHPNTPASDCRSLYVGDAILAVNGHDLSAMNHSAAVTLLSRPAETVTLQLLFVPPESDETCSNSDDPFTFKYGLFDDDVASLASSSCSVVPRHCSLPPPPLDSLSRASVDSVRGSCDNLLADDSLAGVVGGLGTQSTEVPVEASSPVMPISSSGSVLESQASSNSTAGVGNSQPTSDRQNGDLALGPTTGGETVSPVRLVAVKTQHQALGELSTSTVPHSPHSNSSPSAHLYRRHSSSNAGLPSSPPTPVHRKHSSSNSVRHKSSYSKSTSLMNYENDLGASLPTARCKSIVGDNGVSPAQDSGSSQMGAAVRHETCLDSCDHETQAERAMTSLRCNFPSTALLNTYHDTVGAGTAGAGTADGGVAGVSADESSPYEHMMPLHKVEQKMTML